MPTLLILTLVCSIVAPAEVKSTGVGLIGKRAVTSREVQIQHLLEVALTEPLRQENLRLAGLDSRAFARDVADTLLENAVALEAQSFNLMQVSPEDLSKAKRLATQVLNGRPVWNGLHVDPREFDEGIRRKLQARRFVKFRSESSAMPVTDVEIQRAYDENHAKYGNLAFENARENIKSSLAKGQTEKRLKDWYDGLLAKYQVKNLIAEM